MNAILASRESKQSLEGKYLFFVLAGESYGVGVLKVREIIKLQAITPVPEVPDYIKGVINLRGKVIPVMDLRLKFRMEHHEMGSRTCILVVKVKGKEGTQVVGVIVDGVEEVAMVRAEDIETMPDFGDSLSVNYLLGVVKIKENVKMLMDIDQVIHAEGLPIESENHFSQAIENSSLAVA